MESKLSSKKSYKVDGCRLQWRMYWRELLVMPATTISTMQYQASAASGTKIVLEIRVTWYSISYWILDNHGRY